MRLRVCVRGGYARSYKGEVGVKRLLEAVQLAVREYVSFLSRAFDVARRRRGLAVWRSETSCVF